MRFYTSLLAAITLATCSLAIPTHCADEATTNEITLDQPIDYSLFAESDQSILNPAFETEIFSSADVAIVDDWKTEVVKQHNAYRAHYGAGPLTWSDALYPGTLQWAQQCKFQHSKGNYGENLAAGTGNSYGFSNGLKSWMDEASKYDWNHPGFSSATGHFTQVVWKNSKQVACAIANCRAGTIFGQESKYVVCRYSPPGNFAGQYQQNVGRYRN